MEFEDDTTTTPLPPLPSSTATTTTTTTTFTSVLKTEASTSASKDATAVTDERTEETMTTTESEFTAPGSRIASTSNAELKPTPTPTPKTYEPGVAPIKPEYLIFRSGRSALDIGIAPNDDDAAEAGGSHITTSDEKALTPQGGVDRRPRSRPSQNSHKYTKAEKKAFKGQNKSRHFSKTTDSLDLCWRIATGSGCSLTAGECRYTHDVGEYLRVKERDLRVPGGGDLEGTGVGELGVGRVGGSEGSGREKGASGGKEKEKPEEQYILIKSPDPFFEADEEGGSHIREGNVALLVREPEQQQPEPEPESKGLAGFECIDPTTTCPTYETFGECRFGFKCRFLGGHVRALPLPSTTSTSSSSALAPAQAPALDGVPLQLLTNPALIAQIQLSQTAHEMNRIDPGVLKLLRTKKYPLPKTDAYLSSIGLETMGEQQKSWEVKQEKKHAREREMKGERAKNRLRNRASRRDQDGDVVFEEPEQELDGGAGEGEGEGKMDVEAKEGEEDIQMSAPPPSTSSTSNTINPVEPPSGPVSEIATSSSSTTIDATTTTTTTTTTNTTSTTATPDTIATPALTTEEIIAKRTSESVPHEGKDVSMQDQDQNQNQNQNQDKDQDQDDSDLKARIRPREKKRLMWDGLNYLAPLTTVGNLPFRRLCTYLGADITCGEMSLTHPLLSGQPHEWSLLRRHPSEKIFGVQVAGSRPGVLVPVAEVVGREFGGAGVDFVDVNCGCPIDMVFNSGSGSALLDTPSKLARILGGMSYALGDVPLTIKVRTGVKEGKNTVHRMLPRLVGGGGEAGESREGRDRDRDREEPVGIGCVSIHGRTRQQRYTKSADWEYIKLCVDKVREREEEEDLSPIPIFGNGDIFSPSTARSQILSTGVSGLMVGRGALIKPWIFSELSAYGVNGTSVSGSQPRLCADSYELIGRTRGMEGVAEGLGVRVGGGGGVPFSLSSSPMYATGDYDISSRERLSLIRLYALYALDHFGSDTPGVSKARRYLCEMLSFMWRYIPVGVLERVPVGINERGPGVGVFRGRDELEGLLGSADCRDWVRISEMFLGKTPEGWKFVPKHKSNAYGSEESQG